MGIIEIIILSVGLAMDAFAVSICKGLAMKKKMNWKNAVIIGIWFGGFQALMPLIGFVLGMGFSQYIQQVDHWIAFILLALIGINMIREAFGSDEEENEEEDMLSVKEMFLLAVATSIDALAVGVTFAFLNVKIIPAITSIGIITFIISLIGVRTGNVFGTKYKSKAEIAGGVILIGIGLKILLGHLGVF